MSTGGASGTGGTAGTSSPAGTMGTGGLTSTGGITAGTDGNTGMGGTRGTGGATSTGGAVGTGGSSVGPPPSTCGNGLLDPNELCDCGADPTKLPSGCNAVNGPFYGDGKGCSKTCTREPSCLDSAGKTQACATACGDGNLDAGEDCDDGNLVDGDGCSGKCKIEDGFKCATEYTSKSHLAQGGFFPLDALNPSQATLCNLWPYWKHGDGTPFWKTCTGDQYLWIPRVMASDCVSGDSLDDGCWVTSVPGVKHDAYFTIEARYYFAYDGTLGISPSSYSGNDLYIFINGVLVLDLGGVHLQLPGKVTVSGSPGDARVLEGGCMDTAGNQVGASAGSTACLPGNINPKIPAVSPGDFSDHTGQAWPRDRQGLRDRNLRRQSTSDRF